VFTPAPCPSLSQPFRPFQYTILYTDVPLSTLSQPSVPFLSTMLYRVQCLLPFHFVSSPSTSRLFLSTELCTRRSMSFPVPALQTFLSTTLYTGVPLSSLPQPSDYSFPHNFTPAVHFPSPSQPSKVFFALLMRSSLVVRASDCQCTSCNGPGFDPSIHRHSGI
jgi:hypothetical protein